MTSIVVSKINVYKISGGQGVKAILVACPDLVVLQAYITKNDIKVKSIEIEHELEMAVEEKIVIKDAQLVFSSSFRNDPYVSKEPWPEEKESEKIERIHEGSDDKQEYDPVNGYPVTKRKPKGKK